MFALFGARGCRAESIGKLLNWSVREAKKKVLHLWQDRRASEIYYRPSREILARERKGLKVHEVYGLIEIDLFILSDEVG
jgi:hypothetical protein